MKTFRGRRVNGLSKNTLWTTVSPHDAFAAALGCPHLSRHSWVGAAIVLLNNRASLGTSHWGMIEGGRLTQWCLSTPLGLASFSGLQMGDEMVCGRNGCFWDFILNAVAFRPVCCLLSLVEISFFFCPFWGKRRRFRENKKNAFLARFQLHFFGGIFYDKTGQKMKSLAKMWAANRSHATLYFPGF